MTEQLNSLSVNLSAVVVVVVVVHLVLFSVCSATNCRK